MLKLAPGESSVIDFGAIVPGDAQKSVMFVASSPGNVTARIDGGNGHFRLVNVVCQSVTVVQLTPDEIAQLPPHMQNDPRFHVSVERTVVGTADGSTPLAVGVSQEVSFRAAFQGVDGTGQGVQSATLVIDGSGTTISVPMSALVGQVEADVPTATLSVTQGEAALLSVTFRSTFGPDTAVKVEMDPHSGISMTPASISIQRGGLAQVSLRIEAARLAIPIQVRQDLKISAFDGRQTIFVPLSCQILPAPTPIEQSPAHIQPIQPDWWQWRSINPRNELWKEEYVVSGAFTNMGGFNIQDLAITILEVSEDPANLLLHEANLGSTEHALVQPSRTAPGAVAPIKKEWQWFIPGVWVVKGPTHREFRYKALISAKDVNDVPYPSVASSELRVIVNVSKLKRTSGSFAMGAASAAAALLATIFLAAAGAAAYGAAAAAGAVALDPPEPDPNFLNHVPLPPLGDVPSSGPGRNVIRLYRLTERIMNIELTKSLMEGRRLGALAAGDAASAEMHEQDQAAATAMQRNLADEVRGLEEQAKKEIVAQVPSAIELRREREQLKTSGLSKELADQIQVPAEHRPGFDALLRSDVALSDLDVVGTVEASVVPLAEFAESLE